MKISVRVTKHETHLTLGNEQRVMERDVGGDWVTGTEGSLDLSLIHISEPTRLEC